MQNASLKGIVLILVISSLSLFLNACGRGMTPPSTKLEDGIDPFEESKLPLLEYMIRRGDGISVRFLYNPEFNVSDIKVREDGKISLPIIGDVAAADKSADELTKTISAEYRNYSEKTQYTDVLRAGDELHVRFVYNPQLNQRIAVRPDGKVSLLKLGEIKVEGLSYSKFEEMIRSGYSKFIKDPEMSVIMLSTRTRKIYADEGEITVLITAPQPKDIYIGGEVGKPQLIQTTDWITPIQAISRAEGILASGDGARVIYITKGQDGDALIFKLNLDAYRLAGRKMTNLYLRHGDVLLIPRSGIAKLNLAIDQYIRKALPLNTSLSFSYLLNESRWW